ncbi:MAG TPA: heme-binding protein [Balneolales bacterium]|nr:heme-binding protein [Balneolales bacterium]
MKNTMDSQNKTQQLVNAIFSAIEKMIPDYMAVTEDRAITNGNVAACIIDEDGLVYGKMFGTDKARQRQSYKVAWTKASQVWLTGEKTGEYERRVFNKEIGENANGIEAPDLIGWEGGQPLVRKNGSILSVGFSGFRGFNDLEIMRKAFDEVEQ